MAFVDVANNCSCTTITVKDTIKCVYVLFTRCNDSQSKFVRFHNKTTEDIIYLTGNERSCWSMVDDDDEEEAISFMEYEKFA